MPTRRAWRAAFRRIRVYLPAAILLLAAMVIFLPLSAGWMARELEKRATILTGMEIDVESVRVRLAAGEVLIRGIQVPGPNTASPPFRIGSVRLTGSPANLLAGDGTWPETVEVNAPSRISIVHEESGAFRLDGPAATLQSTISAIAKSKPPTQGSSTPGNAPGPATTPRVILRELTIQAEPPHPSLPAVSLFARRVELEPRLTPESPWFLHANGIVSADATEVWMIEAGYHPESRSLILKGDLGAIGLPIEVPGFGGVTGRLQGVVLGANATLPAKPGEPVSAALELGANRFELFEDRVGGEQWIDRNLSLRARAEYSPDTHRLEVHDARILGDDIQFAASGHVDLVGSLPGEATVRLTQFPAPALRVAAGRLLASSGILVEPEDSSPTLTLIADARGSFVDPASLDGGVSLEAGGWSIRGRDWPAPVLLKRLALRASQRQIALDELHATAGGISLRARMRVPTPDDRGDTTGTLSITADGGAASLVELTQRYGLIPKEVASLDLPVTLSVDAAVRAHAVTADSSRWRDIVLRPEVRDASLVWGRGSVVLYRMSDPIALDPGELNYTEGQVRLNRLTASVGNTRLLANATLSGSPIATLGQVPGPLKLDLRAEADGMAQDLAALLSRIFYLPVPPDLIEGRYHAEIQAGIDTQRMMEPDYKIRVTVNDGAGTIPTPTVNLALTNVSIDAEATNDFVNIRRFKADVADGTTPGSVVELRLDASPNALTVAGNLHSHFEILTTVLPYDLEDIYCSGPLPATISAQLLAAEPLDPGPDLIRRWVATLRRRAGEISVRGQGPLRLSYTVDYRQERPVTFYARDFPMRIENIRGNARATEEAITFTNVLADCGPSKDMLVTGRVVLGKSTDIKFDAAMDYLSISRWLTDWETLPEAQRPVARPVRRTEPNPQPRLLVRLEGNVRAKDVEFLGFTGKNTSGTIIYEAWRHANGIFKIRDIKTEAYGGHGSCEGEFTFRGANMPTLMDLRGKMQRFDVRTFLTDLRKQPEEMDGVVSGEVHFECAIQQQATYSAKGSYLVEESSFVGGKIFTAIRGILNLGSTSGGKDTRMEGTLTVRDREVLLPDIKVTSPALALFASGKVTFDAMLDFDVTANVVSRRFKGVPVIGGALGVLDKLTDFLVSFRVSGTIQDPKVRTVPLMMDRIGLMDRTRVSGMPGGAQP